MLCWTPCPPSGCCIPFKLWRRWLVRPVGFSHCALTCFIPVTLGSNGDTAESPDVAVLDMEPTAPPAPKGVNGGAGASSADGGSGGTTETAVSPPRPMPDKVSPQTPPASTLPMLREEWYANFIRLGGLKHIFQVLLNWGSSRAAVADLSPTLTASGSSDLVSAGEVLMRLERQCLALLLKLVKLFTVGALTVLEPSLINVVRMVRADSVNDAKTEELPVWSRVRLSASSHLSYSSLCCTS